MPVKPLPEESPEALTAPIVVAECESPPPPAASVLEAEDSDVDEDKPDAPGVKLWRLGPIEVTMAAAAPRPAAMRQLRPQGASNRPLAKKIGLLGGSLIMWLGAALVLFAGWTWLGTSVLESGVQNGLMEEFQEELSQAEVAQAPPVGPGLPLAAAPASFTQDAPAPVNFVPKVKKPKGPGVAIIGIPKIGVEKVVVEGTGEDDLKKGPGHYSETPMPGQPGNVGIAGHRTTYGGPFRNVDRLRPGDRIELTTLNGLYVYTVVGSKVVDPSDTSVLNPTEEDMLTLTTCDPPFSDAARLIIMAKLTERPVAAVPAVAAAALQPAGATATRLTPLPELRADQILPPLPAMAPPAPATPPVSPQGSGPQQPAPSGPVPAQSQPIENLPAAPPPQTSPQPPAPPPTAQPRFESGP